MGLELEKLCVGNGIRKGILDYSKLRDIKVTHDELYSAVARVNDACEGGSLLIGGQTASPYFFGHRSRRRPSNDLDFCINVSGLSSLAESKYSNDLFLNEEHGDLVFLYKGMPVSFHLDSVHGLEINEDVWDNGISFGDIRVISPEHTIMMKLRRAATRGRLFGKDRVDITTLMIAPYFKEGSGHVDFERVWELVSRDIDGDVSEYIAGIKKEENNVRKNEREFFSHAYDQLTNVK